MTNSLRRVGSGEANVTIGDPPGRDHSEQPGSAAHAATAPRPFTSRCSDWLPELRWDCSIRGHVPGYPTGIVPAGNWHSMEQSVLPNSGFRNETSVHHCVVPWDISFQRVRH